MKIPLSQRFDKVPNVPMSARPKSCSGCPFSPGITVGSRGPLDSPFVIVGESPGGNELLKGYPFVGPSGDMVEETLEEVGWIRGVDPEPYIINAFQCYPKNKEVSMMQTAVRCCSARLIEDLERYPRKVILTLGGPAAWSLTNNYNLKVTQERGKLYTHHTASIGIVSTVHPAFLMRSGGSSFYQAWKRDLSYTISLLKDQDSKAGLWSPPIWHVIETRDQYSALVERMSAANFIAGDIETGGKNGAGLDHQRGYILELGITSDISNGRIVDIIPGRMLWDNEDLTHKLLGNNATWIWQNGKFDIKFFRYEGINEARIDEDTMLLSYTLNENKGHDLDTIAWDWIGAPKHKSVIDVWFKENGIKNADRDYALIPIAMRHEYAAYDISKTYHMFFPLRQKVREDKHLEKLYTETLIPASEFLTQIEMRGLMLDPQRVQENIERLNTELQGYATEIQKYAVQYLGSPINLNSWQQLQTLLYKRMRLGNVDAKTDEDALIAIQRKFNHPIASLLLKYRKIRKRLSTYCIAALDHYDSKGHFKRGWAGPDGAVHCSFKAHGTTTGRLASEDPNMQNMDRNIWIRGQFVARIKKILAEVDLNQAELRCLAIMSGDKTLIDIYTKNEVSIHHITSVAMFGEHYTDNQKMRAKAINFGIVYGRTAPSIAEEFNISVQEAEEYIRIWLDRYPGARDFIEASGKAPHKMLTMVNNWGRKRRWGVVSNDNLHDLTNQAKNWPHQSTAHEITLSSGIYLQPIIQKVWDAYFVNEIHDALYEEIDNDRSIYGPCIAYTQYVMSQIPKLYGLTRVPFIAEAKIGTRWGGAKNAKDAGLTPEQIKAEGYMYDFKTTPDDLETAFSQIGTKYPYEWMRI